LRKPEQPGFRRSFKFAVLLTLTRLIVQLMQH
jgi:hypothetical protein